MMKQTLKLLVVVGILGILAAPVDAVTVYRLTSNEAAEKDATHQVVLTYADLTDADAGQTIALLNVEDKMGVELVYMELVTDFDSSGDATIITTTITVGDGNDPNGFLTSTELNPSGTEVDLKFKDGALANRFPYTASDTVDVVVACTVATELADHDSGEVHLYFRVWDTR